MEAPETGADLLEPQDWKLPKQTGDAGFPATPGKRGNEQTRRESAVNHRKARSDPGTELLCKRWDGGHLVRSSLPPQPLLDQWGHVLPPGSVFLDSTGTSSFLCYHHHIVGWRFPNCGRVELWDSVSQRGLFPPSSRGKKKAHAQKCFTCVASSSKFSENHPHL